MQADTGPAFAGLSGRSWALTQVDKRVGYTTLSNAVWGYRRHLGGLDPESGKFRPLSDRQILLLLAMEAVTHLPRPEKGTLLEALQSRLISGRGRNPHKEHLARELQELHDLQVIVLSRTNDGQVTHWDLSPFLDQVEAAKSHYRSTRLSAGSAPAWSAETAATPRATDNSAALEEENRRLREQVERRALGPVAPATGSLDAGTSAGQAIPSVAAAAGAPIGSTPAAVGAGSGPSGEQTRSTDSSTERDPSGEVTRSMICTAAVDEEVDRSRDRSTSSSTGLEESVHNARTQAVEGAGSPCRREAGRLSAAAALLHLGFEDLPPPMRLAIQAEEDREWHQGTLTREFLVPRYAAFLLSGKWCDWLLQEQCRAACAAADPHYAASPPRRWGTWWTHPGWTDPDRPAGHGWQEQPRPVRQRVRALLEGQHPAPSWRPALSTATPGQAQERAPALSNSGPTPTPRPCSGSREAAGPSSGIRPSSLSAGAATPKAQAWDDGLLPGRYFEELALPLPLQVIARDPQYGPPDPRVAAQLAQHHVTWEMVEQRRTQAQQALGLGT